jgi:hypothetical protein
MTMSPLRPFRLGAAGLLFLVRDEGFGDHWAEGVTRISTDDTDL